MTKLFKPGCYVTMQWLRVLRCSLLVSSMAMLSAPAMADSVTLKYELPDEQTYYHFRLLQATPKKFINENIQVDIKPSIETQSLFKVVVTDDPAGRRISTSLANPSSDVQSAFVLNPDSKDFQIQAVQAFNQIFSLSIPEYTVNDAGEVVDVLVTDTYKEDIRALFHSVFSIVGRNSAIKTRLQKSLDASLAVATGEAYMPLVKRQRLNVSTLNGMSLEMGVNSNELIKLYDTDSKGNVAGVLKFVNRVPCHPGADADSCVLLQHLVDVDESDTNAKKVVTATVVTELVIDPNNLRVHSLDAVSTQTTQLPKMKEPYTNQTLVIERVYLDGEPDVNETNSQLSNFAKNVDFEIRNATWNDFESLNRSRIRSINHSLNFCSRQSSRVSAKMKEKNSSMRDTNADNCAKLKAFFNDVTLMKVFDHFESRYTPELLPDPKSQSLLQSAENFLERRIPTLIRIEMARLQAEDSSLTTKQLFLKAPEMARRLIAESPIKSERHQRYLAKLPEYFDELARTFDDGARAKAPER